MAQNQDGTPLCECGGWCLIPPAEALGWPKNLGHATSPHEAQLARFAQSAAALVALSATNEPLESDLVVTEGHRHDTEETVILWRQLGQWSFERFVFGLTVRRIDTFPFRLPLSVGGTAAPLRVIYPRVRVTVTNNATLDATLQLTGDIVRLPGGAPVVVATLPALRITSQGAPLVNFVNRWFAFGPVEVSEADLVAAQGRLALRLTGEMEGAAEGGTVFEDRKSTRLNSSHSRASRMPSSA